MEASKTLDRHIVSGPTVSDPKQQHVIKTEQYLLEFAFFGQTRMVYELNLKLETGEIKVI